MSRSKDFVDFQEISIITKITMEDDYMQEDYDPLDDNSISDIVAMDRIAEEAALLLLRYDSGCSYRYANVYDRYNVMRRSYEYPPMEFVAWNFTASTANIFLTGYLCPNDLLEIGIRRLYYVMRQIGETRVYRGYIRFIHSMTIYKIKKRFASVFGKRTIWDPVVSLLDKAKFDTGEVVAGPWDIYCIPMFDEVRDPDADVFYREVERVVRTFEDDPMLEDEEVIDYEDVD